MGCCLGVAWGGGDYELDTANLRDLPLISYIGYLGWAWARARTDTATEVTSRKYYRDQQALVKDIHSTGSFRKWTKLLRETVLGGKASRFAATAKDVVKLGRIEKEAADREAGPRFFKSVIDGYAEAEDPTQISLKRLIQLVGRVYGRWLATQTADQGAAATSALAVGTGDEVDHKAIYKMVLDKIQTLEHW
ncbi:hypothetical protein CYMTET_14447 [Cymbomonas tetramitiformis]|uniref:Uncharacterized protein n=1 Tax=Cymbomonas tetramitiformis TaxID=36881 RepID=A0AAE0GGJ8_9CHLO|nr:hypothetical protein CYMTET_14447 [Cymbomonas tetramitiformis]